MAAGDTEEAQQGGQSPGKEKQRFEDQGTEGAQEEREQSMARSTAGEAPRRCP